jgi:hypothetical protein
VRRTFIVFAVFCVSASPPAVGAGKPHVCLDLKKPHAAVTVTGTLTKQLFPGPPNYESVAKDDAEEKALILELPARMCADDGEFIESSATFDRVHVSSSIPALLDVLNAAVGRASLSMAKPLGRTRGIIGRPSFSSLMK